MPRRRRNTTEAADQVAEDEPEETGPLRRCIITRERLPKERMIRFVVGPGRASGAGFDCNPARAGNVVERVSGCVRNRSRPGRVGACFCQGRTRSCHVPPDLPAVLEAALIRRIGELLGLARRAGQAVAGFDKAREFMRSWPGSAGPAGVGRQRGGTRAVPVGSERIRWSCWLLFRPRCLAGCSVVTMWCMLRSRLGGSASVWRSKRDG